MKIRNLNWMLCLQKLPVIYDYFISGGNIFFAKDGFIFTELLFIAAEISALVSALFRSIQPWRIRYRNRVRRKG